ncbi:MAG: polysaccharide biosynthesis protein [Rhodobacteraceae bacterium]|nr:polysaccharide biosynthesis protein [Paracoccaceae bacterium]
MTYDFAKSLTRSQKRNILLLADMVNAIAAFLLAWAVVRGTTLPGAEILEASKFFTVLMLTSLVLTLSFGLHRIKLNAFELQGMLEIGVVAIALGLTGVLANLLPGLKLPLQTFIVVAMSYAILSVGFRLALRQYLIWLYSKHQVRKRVLVYGAGQTGQQLVAALKTDHAFRPIGFVDDNPSIHDMTIGGLRVFSPIRIGDLVERELVDRVIIAMPSASDGIRAGISHRLRDLGCEVHSVPSFAELLVAGKSLNKTEPVQVDELLGRSAFSENLPEVNGAYNNRRVLITGAGGSIGAELCRQLLASAPECLVLLDHSEFALYNIHRELNGLEKTLGIVPVLGSVADPALMRRVMKDYAIDIVLHTAAYKHLPMVQSNIATGLNNNVLGTRIVAEAALEARVERFILVSSDKAVRPTSVMGASKRLAELVVQDMAARAEKTRFSMVRFGNVLGSSGSVLPLFQEQISSGGPLTITHPNVTRFFMTMSEAVSLVLLAGTFARGGEVFVLNMGKPVRIRDLARHMINHAGYSVKDTSNPTGDIEIVEIGLRDGEKLHEELLIGSDMLTTPHPKILRAQESSLTSAEISGLLADLEAAINNADDEAVRVIISKWVEPEHENVTVLNVVNG